MLSIAIIIFREFLEIAIILGVISVALKDCAGKNKLFFAGACLGILGSAMLAIFIEQITNAFEGMGQEIVNSIIMSLAIALIIYTIIWMQSRSRKFSQEIKDRGAQIAKGEAAPKGMILLIALTILREGTEVVLFSYGLLSTGSISYGQFSTGAMLGLASGVVFMLIFKTGFMKIKTKYIFTTTTIFLAFVASSLASKVAGNLLAIGFFDFLSIELWDSSWLIEDGSAFGKFAHAIVGYVARPAAIELLFYLSTMFTIYVLYQVKKSDRRITV